MCYKHLENVYYWNTISTDQQNPFGDMDFSYNQQNRDTGRHNKTYVVEIISRNIGIYGETCLYATYGIKNLLVAGSVLVDIVQGFDCKWNVYIPSFFQQQWIEMSRMLKKASKWCLLCMKTNI